MLFQCCINFLLQLCNFEIGGTTSVDPFDLESMAENLTASTGAVKKTPQSFLGENSALVNLDNLVSASTIKPTAPTPAGTFLFASHLNKTYKYLNKTYINIEKEKSSIQNQNSYLSQKIFVFFKIIYSIMKSLTK